MSEWVMDELTGNRMQRGASPALHVVKGDVDTLTRETGQNSRDQKSGKAPVKLVYTLIELSGEDKKDFLKAMDWPRLRKHLEACANDPGETGPRMRRGLAMIESEAPLRCLRIEDFGARGLQGEDFDSKKNFGLLCRAEFKTSNEGGRGGSYGLGKAVLWRFSGIATVLLSSVVQGCESKGIRLFGRTDIPSHSIPGDREYQSSGWFGARQKSKTDSTYYAEFNIRRQQARKVAASGSSFCKKQWRIRTDRGLLRTRPGRGSQPRRNWQRDRSECRKMVLAQHDRSQRLDGGGSQGGEKRSRDFQKNGRSKSRMGAFLSRAEWGHDGRHRKGARRGCGAGV